MQIPFLQRPVSQQWEPLPVARVPGLILWAWFRPQHLLSGMTIGIPPAVVSASVTGFGFSVNDLLLSAGVMLQQFQAVSLFGGQWQAVGAFGPFLHHAVPAVPPGVAPQIALSFFEPMMAPAVTAAHPPFAVAAVDVLDDDLDQSPPTSNAQLYDRIESSWKAAIQMERQMTGTRKKLSGLLSALNKLDRDLTPEERLSADREDKDSWEDARRWARDLAAKCHREIKQFDIGMTSGAGRRNLMAQVYEQVIEPRKPCSELDTHHRNFQTYRKDMTSLQRAMTSAVQAASSNGTQRSQRVLSSIQKKIQDRRRRMREPVGGTSMARSCRRKR